ncbi:hypothetical protein [Amycolatopsis orientalis]|uniref:hypothetical protein n=1 Tax=Amycolatopsis orientalis TaxID=31958 RepID=UPI00055EB333|nr:hypothetical protein [Amycolatopsis orientalis]
MTRPDARRLATAIYRRFAALYRERHPGTGSVTEEYLAVLMVGVPEIDLDIDTMKVVLHPESRVAAWSRYASTLRALTDDDDTVTWFKDIHGQLAKLLPAWTPPPRDIAAITDDAEFMATIRRLRDTPRPIAVAELARRMRDRDKKNSWARTQLGVNLKTLPKDKPDHVRNLLETLCDHAGRPPADASHLYETWRRLRGLERKPPPQPHEQREVVTASMPVVNPQPEPETTLPVAPIVPRWPLARTLLILGLVAFAIIIVIIAVM